MSASAKTGHFRVGPHGIAYVLHNPQFLAVDVPPVVFVHGFTMSVRFWELAMLPEIRAGRCWLSVSLPLHAPSLFDGDPREAELSGAHLGALLGRVVHGLLGEREVLVVGHSVGAVVALAYAGVYRRLCGGVFAIGGFAAGADSGIEDALAGLHEGGGLSRAGFAALFAGMQRSLWFTRQIVRKYAADTDALEAYPHFESTLALVHPDLAHHDRGAMLHFVGALYLVDALPDPGAVVCPVWVIAGRADPVIPFAVQERLASLLPAGQLHVFPGAGHLTFAERPEQFNALLLRFVGLDGGVPVG